MAEAWHAELAAALGSPIGSVTPVDGGDINDASCVELVDRRRVFVKTHAAPPRGMYVAEAAGLDWLRAGPVRVPRVLAVGATFLALEWLALGPRPERSDAQLGRGLAGLHRLGAPTFGHDGASFLGTLPQDNTPAPDLATLWIERRLRPLLAQLHRAGRLDDRGAQLDRLAARPERFGPPEPPARLHGDLWWGNVGFVGADPVLIDPAVYGGHREIDLAMLQLFGGVNEALVGGYEEVWPLEPTWRERTPLWQLYPLAAHGVLFGGGYPRQVADLLDDLA